MPALDTLPTPSGGDDIYNVFSVNFARLDRRAPQNFMMADVHDGPMPLDYNFWIAHNDNRTILIDTGFGPRAAGERKRTLIVDPIEALRTLGLDPDAIEDVFITHLHYDHAGNMDRLAKARFHIQDSEVAMATGRCMCEKFMRAPYDVEDIVTLVRHNFAGRLCFYDGTAAPLPGISLHHLPGHTAGIQAIRVNTQRGPILLASDVSHYYANFVRKSPFVIILDVADSLQSYDAMYDLVAGVDHIIPGHDPLIRALYPSVTVCGLEMAALHETPMPLDSQRLA